MHFHHCFSPVYILTLPSCQQWHLWSYSKMELWQVHWAVDWFVAFGLEAHSSMKLSVIFRMMDLKRLHFSWAYHSPSRFFQHWSEFRILFPWSQHRRKFQSKKRNRLLTTTMMHWGWGRDWYEHPLPKHLVLVLLFIIHYYMWDSVKEIITFFPHWHFAVN